MLPYTCYANFLTSFSGRNIQWQYIHGLFLSAIYGGRVDNSFDLQVLESYLLSLFDNKLLGAHASDKRIGPLMIPRSCEAKVRTFLTDVQFMP